MSGVENEFHSVFSSFMGPFKITVLITVYGEKSFKININDVTLFLTYLN